MGCLQQNLKLNDVSVWVLKLWRKQRNELY